MAPTSIQPPGYSSQHSISLPHGASLSRGRYCSRSSVGSICGSVDLERMLLRKVDRLSNTETAVDMDDALHETGHGKFQYCLWLICGLIYSCCSLSTTTLSFVLPAATCDFHLSAGDKGLLNVMPVAGMMVGSYVWGFFADSKGRKFVLVSSLLTDGCAGVISSLCQEKISFLIVRIFNGFGIIGSVSVVFAYLGEFLTDAKRDKILSSLELFWTLGIVVEPIIGYIFIPQKWEVGFKNYFVYNSWRLYVFLCGLPSVIMGITMLRMPESPRFLLLQGKLHKARAVLQLMYKVNSGKKASEFPVKVLLPSAQAEFYFFKSLHDISYFQVIRQTFTGIYKLHVFLFSYCKKNIALTSYIDFGLNCSYNTLINWVPELLNNMNHWEDNYGSGYSICEVEEGVVHPGSSSNLSSRMIFLHPKNLQFVMQESFAYQQLHSGLNHISEEERKYGGDACEIDVDVFIETFIVCLCCLPTTIAVLYCIQHISKKVLLTTAMFTAAVVTFTATLVRDSEHLFYLMCMFEAFTTVVEAVLFCIVVEIFPDQVRGIALCLTVTIGRFGGVVGNLLFGVMITTHCLLPFYTFVFLLASSCIAIWCFPSLKLGH